MRKYFRKGNFMKIEYDDYYKCYVVWLVENSSMSEVFRGNKKDCEKYVKRKKKRGKRK